MSDENVVSIPATSPEWPSIAQFYAQRDVFVTGATGFLGKCLVEKLIRSIPDIGRVMILIRPKRGKTVKERLDALLSSKVRTDTGSAESPLVQQVQVHRFDSARPRPIFI